MINTGISLSQGVMRGGAVLPHSGRPQITGSLVEGATLSVVGLIWPKGTTVTRKWFRVGGDPNTPIATGLTYALTAGDADHQVYAKEKGSFRGYSLEFPTAPTDVIAHAGPPLNAPSVLVAPSITGDLTVGNTAAASVGQWAANPEATFVVTWQGYSGGGWNDLVNGLTKVLAASDEAAGPGTLRIRVVASNSEGDTVAYSDPVTVHAAVKILVPPVNVQPPTISGVTTEGEVLTVNIGVWSPVPTTVIFEWLRDDVVISGANTYQYTQVAADIGHAIKSRVTAGNDDGSNVAVSAPTELVKAAAPPTAAPANTALPRLAGTATVGAKLNVIPGQWSGYPAPTFTYEIFADNVSRGAPVAGIYQVQDVDATKTITVKEVASNGVGPDIVVQSLGIGPIHNVEPDAAHILGINLSGMEYSDEGTIDVYQIQIPDDYIDEVKAKGFTDIRLPIKWDRIERSENRNVFDTLNWGNVISAITRIRAKGLKTLLDIHNFGARVVQQNKTTTPVNETNFLGTGWTHYGATDAATGFLEDNSNGDHDLKFDWSAEGSGTATITVEAKTNPGYTGNGSFKINLLGVNQEAGFRMSDGVLYAGNSPGGQASSSGPDADGYRTFVMTYPVKGASTQTVNIGAGATTGAYAGNHYQGVPGQQPLLIKSIKVDFTLAQKYYVGIGELFHDGTPALPPSDLAATWGRIVTDIISRGLEDGISGWDIMNEPNSVQSADLWFQTAQLCIYAIRAAGSKLPILVEGKPYSGALTFPEQNPNLPALVDPEDNLIFSGHCYGDYDNSGATTGLPMHWDVQGGRPVEIPLVPGEVVDDMTLVRRCDHMLQWLRGKGSKRLHIGEVGVGRDDPHWNSQLRNFMDWAIANKVWVSFWAGGPAWGDGYELRWTRYNDGLQSEQMAVIDQYKGNPAPTIYRASGPRRISPGSSTVMMTVQYNGRIASPITFTPHCDQGGTFSPATLTTDVPENYVGVVTYTPVANRNSLVTWTNDKGLTDPAALPFSSFVDSFTQIEADGANTSRVFSVYRRLYKSYTGPMIRLWKQVGGVAAEQDFGRAANSELLDLAAVAAWTAGADGNIIKVSKIYDQGPGASLLGRGNIQARLDTEGGWAAPSPADYPLWVIGGDGKPLARWTGTGTSSMDFGDSVLNRSNITVAAVIKHNSGSNDIHWQFANNFSVWPTYRCDKDGTSLTYNQTSGNWYHFAASRKRNSTTGTNLYLNGEKVTTAGALDNTIQVNPDGIHGPDYRDTCQLGYYRFTSGTNLGGFDLRELVTIDGNPSEANLGALFTDANSTYAITGLTAITPLNVYVPEFDINFLTGTEKHNGSTVAAGTYWSGGKTLDHATKGMFFNRTTNRGKGLIGAMRDAVFSDAFTIRIVIRDFVNVNAGPNKISLFSRDGTQWIYTKFLRWCGNLTTNDYLPSDIDYTMPVGATFAYSDHDQTIVISRGKGRKITICYEPNGTNGISQHDASNDPPFAAPALLQIGDNSATAGYAGFEGYISRISVWASDVQDIMQVPDLGAVTTPLDIQPRAPLPIFFNGENLSGLEFGGASLGPFEQEIDYYSGNGTPQYPGHGCNMYRLPFSPDRLFTSWINYLKDTTNNPFPTPADTTVAGMDPTVKAQIQRHMTYAIAKGQHTLLDWHGFGGPLGKSLGGTFPDALGAAVWKAIASIWNGPYVHYDLQNEPQAAASVTGLYATYQNWVNAIRTVPEAVGDIHLEPGAEGNYGHIYTFGMDFDGVESKNSAGFRTVTDPLNKLVAHGHHYVDHDGSGRYDDIAGKYNGLIVLAGATQWARKYGIRLFLGEFGSTNDPANHPDNDRENRWMIKYLAQHKDAWLGFSYWGAGTYWGPGYVYNNWPANIGTANQQDRPQMSFLDLYPGTGSVQIVVPTGPVALAKVGAVTDISALAGDTTNVYQTDLRIDPNDPKAQTVTAKYGANGDGEDTSAAFSTLDRWLTASKTTWPGTGDPDVVYDKDGVGYWTSLDRGGGTTNGIRKKPKGSLIWGGSTNISGGSVDHPHVMIDRWPESPYYGRFYFAGRGGSPTMWRTDPPVPPSPWPATSVNGPGTFNAGFIFGGCVAQTGEVFWPYKSAQTLVTTNGVYGGTWSDYFVLKSVNGGANFRAIKIFTTTPIANGQASYYGSSNMAYSPATPALPNGRLHVLIWQYVSNAPTKMYYFHSDDLGETWSPELVSLGEVPNFSPRGATLMVNPAGILVLSWMAENGTTCRMYAIASRDAGKTWSTPFQVSTTDWLEPSFTTQTRVPTQDQMYSDVSLSDGTFEIVWTQNVNGLYRAFRQQLTAA